MKTESSSPLLLPTGKHRHSTTSQHKTTSQAPNVQTQGGGGISYSELNRSLGIVCVEKLSDYLEERSLKIKNNVGFAESKDWAQY